MKCNLGRKLGYSFGGCDMYRDNKRSYCECTDVCVFFVRLSVSLCVLGLVSRAFLMKTYTKKMSCGKLFEGSVMDS